MTTAEPNRVEPSTIWQKIGVAVPSCPNLLQGVAQATNQLLTTRPHTTAISQTLATLGQVTGADRVYIFEMHPHPETAEPALSQRFEWARDTVTAEIDNPLLQNIPYAATSMIRLHEALQAGQTCSGLVRDLSAVERELLEPQGIVSILIVPILINGKFWGMLGFDDCHTERHWSKDESAILMTMAATIGSFITERQQSEEDLRASEARLQSFFEATFEAVLIHDYGEILDVNYATEALYGYSKVELIGRSVLDLAAPCSRDLIQSRAQFPSDQLFEAVGLKKDGRTFIAEVSGKSITYQGRPARVTGMRDITARKQAEDALRQSEARNRALLNAIPDLMFRFSRDGTYLDCHAEIVSDLLAPVSELIGKKIQDVVPKTIAQLYFQQMHQALATGKTQTWEYEMPINGNLRYWESRIVVCGDDEVLAIVRDITERKRAEEERLLTAERDRLLAQIALRIRRSLNLDQILHTTVAEIRQFLECDRVFITCIDHQFQGNVFAESVAPNLDSILGELPCNSPDFIELIREIKTLFESGNIQVINDIAAADISPLLRQYLIHYQVKAGMAVPIMLNDQLFGNLVVHQCDRTRNWQLFEINLLRALATQVAIAIQQAQLYQQVQDLNTNLEYQVEERTQQLEQKYTELQELNRLKDIFFHAVSHDLRTPVLGWLMVLKNLLDGGVSTLPSPQSPIPVSLSILERMVQSCDRQLRLINSLLEVHASEMGGILIEREPVKLGELVQVLVEDFEPIVAKNQAQLINQVPNNLPIINADPAQLRRVFENLLSNAFNHNPPGIILTLDAQVEDNMICCTVADNGVGINPEMCVSEAGSQKPRLFQLYFRGQNVQGHRPYTGLGLGLYLCDQIITTHGGAIGVNSRQGEGTIFWFTLPILFPAD